MKIIETIVSEGEDGATYVSLTLADSAEIDSAKEWVELRLKIPMVGNPPFAAIQGDTLERARTLIKQQIGRLESHAADSG